MAAKPKGRAPRPSQKDIEFEKLLRRAEKFQKQVKNQTVVRRGRKQSG